MIWRNFGGKNSINIKQLELKIKISVKLENLMKRAQALGVNYYEECVKHMSMHCDDAAATDLKKIIEQFTLLQTSSAGCVVVSGEKSTVEEIKPVAAVAAVVANGAATCVVDDNDDNPEEDNNTTANNNNDDNNKLQESEQLIPAQTINNRHVEIISISKNIIIIKASFLFEHSFF